MPGTKKPLAYQRILLKLSGESLLGEKTFGIDRTFADYIAAEIHEVLALGLEIAVVAGGGNIFRGVSDSAQGMDRVSADHMGMLATVINALALQDSLERASCFTRVLSAIDMKEVAEPFIRRRAMRHMEKGRVVIFAAGIGNPYFSTDTAAALRAMEIGADVLLMAKNIDGVYDKDPKKHKDAKRYAQVSFTDALVRDLRVMDATAFALCRDNDLSIAVFELATPGNIQRVVCGEPIGTIVKNNQETRFANAT